MDESSKKLLMGFGATFTSFLLWGVLPVYWAQMFYLPFLGMAAYRIFWSFLFVSVLITIFGQWKEVSQIWQDRKTTLLLFICGILIGGNWCTYMLAISSGHVIEASMGYYINPLANALLGMVFFRERPRFLQKIAIICALAGVVYMVTAYGRLPVFALILAFSFATYAALHKLIKANVLNGMFFEMFILLTPSLLYIIIASAGGYMPVFFHETWFNMFIIAFGGVFTAVPLMGFAFGVKRLPLTTVGILQYVSPTATFILGVLYFKEPMTKELLIVFAFIWTGVFLYALEGIRKMRR
jgi:chloramphenicol-sensitive protein RarD